MANTTAATMNMSVDDSIVMPQPELKQASSEHATKKDDKHLERLVRPVYRREDFIKKSKHGKMIRDEKMAQDPNYFFYGMMAAYTRQKLVNDENKLGDDQLEHHITC